MKNITDQHMAAQNLPHETHTRLLLGETIPICSCGDIITSRPMILKQGKQFNCDKCGAILRVGKIVTDCNKFGLVMKKQCLSCPIGRPHIDAKKICPEAKKLKWMPVDSTNPKKFALDIEEFQKQNPYQK